MTNVNFYSKEQIDAKVPDSSAASVGDVLTIGTGGTHEWAAGGGGLPDPTSASAGDVLTLDSNKDAIWQTPSGGGTVTTSMNRNTFLDWFANANYGDRLDGVISVTDKNNR